MGGRGSSSASRGYERRDYDRARSDGFDHEEAVQRAKAAAWHRARLGEKYTGKTAEENRAIASQSARESWARVTNATYERGRKSREAEVEGWLSGKRRKRR